MENLKKDAKRFVKKALVRSGLWDPFRKPFKALEFETTAYCNRKCSYCPVSLYDRTGPLDGRYMKEDVFLKMVGDLESFQFSGLIAPHLYGEPLTDPRLTKWMSILRKSLPRSTIKVVTNGDFLDKKKFDDLIAAGVNYFNISKHGATLPKALIELIDSLTPQERKKRFNVLDFYQDYKNQQSMLNTRGGEVHLRHQSLQKKRNPIACSFVVYPVLNTYGELILCCNDYHNDHTFGNIMEQHLLDLWNSPKNMEVRKRIFKAYFDLPICQNCYM
jgi:MoaA/NifB/PqqE/SkfB family radical SAM enzyme